EIFGRAAAENEDRRLAAVLVAHIALPVNRTALGGEHYACGLVYVERRIEGEFVPLQRLRRNVHADGRIAGTRSVERHAELVSGGDERFVLKPKLALALAHVLAAQVVKLGR